MGVGVESLLEQIPVTTVNHWRNRGGHRLRAGGRGIARHGVAFFAALAGHIALICALVLPSGSRQSKSSVQAPVRTWILIPQRPVVDHSYRLRLPQTSHAITAIRVKPIEIPPTWTSGRAKPRPAIDWAAQARRAAIAAAGRLGHKLFGVSADRKSPNKVESETPLQRAGESYRDVYGDQVDWVSDRCYIVSPEEAPGSLQALAQLRLTRTVCVDNGPSTGNLFKSRIPFYLKRIPTVRVRSAH